MILEKTKIYGNPVDNNCLFSFLAVNAGIKTPIYSISFKIMHY